MSNRPAIRAERLFVEMCAGVFWPPAAIVTVAQEEAPGAQSRPKRLYCPRLLVAEQLKRPALDDHVERSGTNSGIEQISDVVRQPPGRNVLHVVACTSRRLVV